MKKRSKDIEVFSLSFLDIISCAFGAIILILLVIKKGDTRLEETTNLNNLEEQIINNVNILQNIEKLKEENKSLNSFISSKLNDIKNLNSQLENKKNEIESNALRNKEKENSIEALELAANSLNEAKNKVGKKSFKDKEIGGIPVDSEYVVFIIDTSGSMKAIWGKVTKELINVLNIHPKVKGFQILNDNGQHLLGAYENKWIPDTPSKRNNMMNILKNWNSASNSSPVEGLEIALKRYTSKKHNTSIYIFGDEFTGGSYTPVFSTIERLSTKRNIRINGVGFISLGSTNDRFATLMREIAEKN
ncbi:MAG: hypothetical protein VX089_03325, partial [Pseudomonadota bacterium]|nr:hypothetical protein [Pseudomonadota bacterium]